LKIEYKEETNKIEGKEFSALLFNGNNSSTVVTRDFT